MKTYEKTSAVSFPLGGIGAGSIGLAGNGSLIDWEILNRPKRGSHNSFSHFAVKAEREGKVIDARVLQGDTSMGYMGRPAVHDEPWVYGNGVNRETMAGMVHFESARFSAFYPMAQIDFSDPHFPAEVTMRALNPFIPMNDKDSSLPMAMFEFEIRNTTDATVEYSLAFSCNNLFEGSRKNIFADNGILLTTDEGEDNMFISAPDGISSYQEHWYRGGWFDELTTFWREFSAPFPLQNRSYETAKEYGSDVCTVISSVKLAAGKSEKLRMLLCWYAPTVTKYWDKKKQKMKNYYSTLFLSSADVADYCIRNWEYLWNTTVLFTHAMEDQSLPEPFLDAIQGNLAILKSTTCLRLEDGTLWGWEGVTEKSGSCEGTCTHVWNYAQSLPHLFPALERSIREAEFKYNIDENGKMGFRTMLPLGSGVSSFRACVDGQMGCVIKTYREWKLCGNDDFIRSKWDKIKSIIAYAWSEKNPDRWDPDRRGVLSGRQHHTLDMELFGECSWLQGYYLAALKAAAEMAEVLGDKIAKEYNYLYENGRKWTEKNLFSGEYYFQNIDLTDKKIPDSYETGQLINSDGYWNNEAKEIKYQIGSGCAITSVIGDWQAEMSGLSGSFDPERKKKTYESIYKYNFKSMRDISNPCRVFCLDGERGTIICSWDGTEAKPAIPLTYAEECMSGFEYAAACGMLKSGMMREAQELCQAVRDRYDGEKRNPWAEIECGASYARSMASYSFLIAYSGFYADICRKAIGFSPLCDGTYFWSCNGSWGTFSREHGKHTLKILYGDIALDYLRIAIPNAPATALNGITVPAAYIDGELNVNLLLKKGDTLTVTV